jgi:hypothetical protein
MTRALGYVRDLALHGQASPGGDREALAPHASAPVPRPSAPSPARRSPAGAAGTAKRLNNTPADAISPAV